MAADIHDELISRWLSGEANSAEEERLAERLLADEDMRKRFVVLADQEAALHVLSQTLVQARQITDAVMGTAPVFTLPARRENFWKRFSPFLAAAAAAAVLAAGALWSIGLRETPPPQIAEKPAPQPAAQASLTPHHQAPLPELIQPETPGEGWEDPLAARHATPPSAPDTPGLALQPRTAPNGIVTAQPSVPERRQGREPVTAEVLKLTPPLGALPGPDNAQTVRPIGQIVFVDGTAHYRPSGADKWFKASSGIHLMPGAAIDTKSARIAIRLDGNIPVFLNEQTIATFNGGNIKLTRGQIVCDTSMAWKTIQVRTSDGLVSHTGTRFSVKVTSGGTVVIVQEGRVKVENDKGAVEVPGGMSVTVPKGKKPGAPQKADVRSLLAWVEPVRHGIASQAPSSGLLGWWKMDETTGTIAADASGNRCDGTLVGGPAWTPDARLRGGLHFDGIDDWVRLPAIANYANAITVAAWVKHDSLGRSMQCYVSVGERVVIRHDGDSKPGQLNFYIRVSGVVHHLRVDDALTQGRWYHVAGTWDGAAQRLYLNGRLVASQDLHGALDSAVGVEIGSQWSGYGGFMHGVIDDVRIYSRALSAEEVVALVVW